MNHTGIKVTKHDLHRLLMRNYKYCHKFDGHYVQNSGTKIFITYLSTGIEWGKIAVWAASFIVGKWLDVDFFAKMKSWKTITGFKIKEYWKKKKLPAKIEIILLIFSKNKYQINTEELLELFKRNCWVSKHWQINKYVLTDMRIHNTILSKQLFPIQHIKTIIKSSLTASNAIHLTTEWTPSSVQYHVCLTLLVLIERCRECCNIMIR